MKINLKGKLGEKIIKIFKIILINNKRLFNINTSSWKNN